MLQFSPKGCYYSILCFFCDPHLDSPAMHNKAPFYSARRDRILPFQPLTTFFWSGCPCRPLTGLSIAQPPPLTCAGRDTRQRMLFCLFTCRATVWVHSLSLPIPHGMHLVVPAHPCFLWVVCHPSRTYPLKEPEQEPQNRFSPLPTAWPCLLTSDPWPHHLLYWLDTGWWCLGLACASFPYISEICLLLMRLSWPGGLFAHPAAHPWLLMAWAIFWGWAFTWPWAFPHSAHSLSLFCSLCVSCRTTLLFLLWCYLTHSLDLLVTLGILGPFIFLGPFWPFS